MAFAATFTFPAIDDVTITANADTVAAFVFENTFELPQLAARLRANTSSLS